MPAAGAQVLHTIRLTATCAPVTHQAPQQQHTLLRCCLTIMKPTPKPCPPQEWTRAAVPAGPLCAGKCHSSALLGSRLLLFAGSMPTCAELAFLDLETLRWGVPARILGPPPDDRMSATAVLAGEEVLVFGGYTFHAREVGDLYRLRLLPSQEDEQARGSVQVPASGRTVRRWSSFWG